jgi:hypothetical protein
MKKSLQALLVLFVMAMMSACSKDPGKTASKVKIVSGNLAAILSSKANNGLLFFGRSSDGKYFTKKVDTDTIDLILPNGTWNLFAISYETATAPVAGTLPNFIGKTYCGKTSATFNGADTSLQIDLTNAGCNDPAFSADTKFMSEYRLPQIDFINCKNIDGALTPNACDQNISAKFNKGYATSYKLVLYEVKNFGETTSPVKIAETPCARTDFTTLTGLVHSTDAQALAGVHIPTPSGGGALMMEVYYSGGAPGAFQACDPSLGFDVLPLVDNARLKIHVDKTPSSAAIYKFYVKTSEVDVCKAPRLGAGLFAAGFGTVGSPYAICSQGQLDFLRSQFLTFKESSFDLLADINYGQRMILPIGDPLTATGSPEATNYYGKVSSAYRPVFDGRGHNISNFVIDCKIPGGSAPNNNVGFFRRLGDVEIRNLTINNGVVFCDNGNSVGVLAGSIMASSGSLFENIKIHGHSDASNYTGAIAGHVVGGGIDLKNIHVKGDYGSGAYAGGFFGMLSLSGPGTIYQSSFNGKIYADKDNSGLTPVSSFAGGIAGSASSTSSISLNQVVVKAINIHGQSMIGGFFGETNNVSITDSYAESILRTSAKTDGVTSWANLGGAIGRMNSGSLNRVLVFNTLKSSNRSTSADHTLGGLVGNGNPASCTNSFYTGAHDGVACGTSLTLSQSKVQTNLTPFGFKIPIKQGVWDAAANPTLSFPCTTGSEGKFYEVTSMNTATSYGAVLPGDIVLCNGSTVTLVPLMNIDSVFTSYPYTWGMPDDTYDVPRLSFEAKIESAVPYLKRDCHGHYATQYGAGTATDPKWVCNYNQFVSMAGNGTNYILKTNVFMENGQHTPLASGVYNLDGNGFGLFDFQMFLPTNISANLNVGIFSKLMATSTIRNLKIEGAKLSGTNVYTTANPIVSVGLLAGVNEGNLMNIQVGGSSQSVTATIVAGDSFAIGGAVGQNSGLIKKSEFDISTDILQGSYPASSTLYAGGVVAFNSGSIEGVRSHSSLSRSLACYSQSAELSFSSNEILGAFVGQNSTNSFIKEVEVDGEFRAQIAPLTSTFNDCKFHLSGKVSPFVAVNSGSVLDFDIDPRLWFMNSQLPYRELFTTSSGTVARGIVHYDSSSSLSFLQGQALVDSGLSWDPVAYPTSGGNAPTPSCSMTQIGRYLSVSVASGNTSNVMGSLLAAGDIIVCNGAKNVVVPNLIKARVLASAPAMSDVLTIVKNPQGTCSNPLFFTSSECSINSATWTAGTSPALPPGRYYDDALTYSVASPLTNSSNALSVKLNGTGISAFSGTTWTVGTDFFNPGLNTWMLDLHLGGSSSLKAPELVKTGGSLEQLGLPF